MEIWSAGYKAFREKLKKARLEAGITQVKAAKALKEKQSYISKCEYGERRVDAVELKSFARLYKKPIAYFID